MKQHPIPADLSDTVSTANTPQPQYTSVDVLRAVEAIVRAHEEVTGKLVSNVSRAIARDFVWVQIAEQLEDAALPFGYHPCGTCGRLAHERDFVPVRVEFMEDGRGRSRPGTLCLSCLRSHGENGRLLVTIAPRIDASSIAVGVVSAITADP